MKVVDSYVDKIGYIHFVLDSGEDKQFPSYWAFSMWSGAENHQELQSLLRQLELKQSNCSRCDEVIKYQFRPHDNIFVCLKCEVIDEFDYEILQILPHLQ